MNGELPQIATFGLCCVLSCLAFKWLKALDAFLLQWLTKT